MTFPSTRRYVASAVVLALAFVALPAPALAAAPGVVVGRVVATDGVTPLSGVVVSLVDKNSQAVFASQPSTERGTFQAQAPAGDYRVVAATSKGAYLAASAVRVAAGANPPVSLTLKQAAASEPAGAPSATPPPARTQLAPAIKWTIIGGIIVTGALVVDAVTTDDKESQASSSTPVN